MSSNPDCTAQTGADVKMFYMIDDCDCGSEPKAPFTVQELNAGSRSFTENRETVQAPNAYGRTCNRTFTSGGTATNPFDLCFGTNQNLMDSAIGGVQMKAPDFSGEVTITDTETLQSPTVDFEELGFLPGMTIDVAGFSNGDNNGLKMVCAVDGSEMTTVACSCDDYNPELIPETATAVTISTGYVTTSANEQSKIAVYRHIPGVFNSKTSTEGLVQAGYGGVITDASLSLNPGEFVSGSFTINTGDFDRCTDLEPPKVQDAGCDCSETIFVDPRDGCSVEYFFGCKQICVTNFSWNLTRALDTKTTNCGITQTAGTPTATFTFEVALDDTSYLCQDECENEGDNILVARVKDCDPCTGEVSGYINYVFPNVTLDQIDIEPDADTCLTQTITGTAQTSDATGGVMFIQRSTKNDNAFRNRIEITSTGPDLAVDVGHAADSVISVDRGDGTTEDIASVAGNNAVTHTFADTEDYEVQITSDSCTSGFTSLRITTPIVCQNLCYVANHIQLYSYQIADGLASASEIDLSGLPCLERAVIAYEAIESVDIEGSCSLTNLAITDGVMSEEAVNDVVVALIDCGRFNGTLEITGGTNAAPSASTAILITELQARGWTVTTN